MARDMVIVHDFFNAADGGGRLVLDLARELEAALAFAYWSRNSYPRTEAAGLTLHDLGVSCLLPGLQTAWIIQAFRRRTGFLADYRVALYSGELAPFAVANHRRGINFWYCHSPSRLVYDQRDFILARQPAWQRPLLRVLIAALARAYPRLVDKMDVIIVNSENVKRRIRRYWGREAEVVYPPCDTARYYWREPEGYYLSTARLVPLKRVDLVIEAFRRMPDKQLVITSGGEELETLRKQAWDAPNIAFTGQVNEEKWRALLGGAIATVYIPVDEDFGMSPVESMAAGKPVIGVAEGGLLETVIPGVTGTLVPRNPDATHVIEAVRWMTPARSRCMRQACERRAQRFSREIFIEHMRALLAAH